MTTHQVFLCLGYNLKLLLHRKLNFLYILKMQTSNIRSISFVILVLVPLTFMSFLPFIQWIWPHTLYTSSVTLRFSLGYRDWLLRRYLSIRIKLFFTLQWFTKTIPWSVNVKLRNLNWVRTLFTTSDRSFLKYREPFINVLTDSTFGPKKKEKTKQNEVTNTGSTNLLKI